MDLYRLASLLLGVVVSALAPVAESRQYEPLGSQGRDGLRPYEANYFVLADSTMSGELKDELHGEFYLSLKYSVLEKAFVNKPYLPDRLSFVYNGLYDFYMLKSDRYESAPIISRRQNPGLVFEFDLSDSGGKVTEWLYINWFHESNGQTIDFAGEDANNNGIDDGVDEFNRQERIGGKEFALAKVSRGWDYGEFVYGRGAKGSNDAAVPGWWRWQANIRLYCDCQAAGVHAGREDRIFWEPVKEQPVIGDYDGIRFLWEQTFEPFFTHPIMYRIEYKTGVKKDSAFQYNTAKLTLNVAVARAWLSLFYFNGYGKELSTYHLRTNYVGIGFEFR